MRSENLPKRIVSEQNYVSKAVTVFPGMSSETAPIPSVPGSTEPVAEETAPSPRGYFNQAQLDDLDLAERVLAAARTHAPALATRQITTDYLAGFASSFEQARAKTTATGQAGDKTGAATLNATGTERALVIALQGIQSAAKQKHRMLAEDDDPATNFPTDGYLIASRLNPNRAALLQNAATLLTKAAQDQLPGYDATALATVRAALTAYQAAEAGQQSTDEAGAADRTARDGLIKNINARRMAIQHAADALWPYTTPASRPTRKSFQLPLSRPFNG